MVRVISFLLDILSVFVWIKVAMYGWAFFVSPAFALPMLTFWQMFGLFYTVRVFTSRVSIADIAAYVLHEPDDDEKKILSLAHSLASLFLALFSWFYLWIGTLFI